uniref:Uncharacterized protein n=1 Tax=Panagrolaimus sp. PS1159 TaxID=55785 RepID=A0AC35EVH1_9BILA
MKESTSHRVLDNKTIYNLFTKNDLNIYVNEYVTEDVEPIVNHGFSDAIIDTILAKKPKMIVSVESHDSFFDPCENDELTDDELLCERLSFERRFRKNDL